MGRGIFSAVEFTDNDTGVHITTREARDDKRLQSAYIAQRNRDGIPIDGKIASRDPSTRAFIGWDGEGWTDSDGQHHYMLFGASTGDAIAGRSLSTVECLELMLRVERAHPNAYHVWFAGNYDVNMILRDLSMDALMSIKQRGRCRWKGYRIHYLKSKIFEVTKGGVTIRIEDVWTFFHTSFVKALREYLGDDLPNIDKIEAGKQSRSSFTMADMPRIREYMALELSYLVRLAGRLRSLLTVAGIRVHRWHGPGAVASVVLRERGWRHRELPASVHDAARYAYSGGRFEQFRIGRHRGRVYQYDIRSAYPHVIAQLPSLTGEWRHEDTPTTIHDFGLYRVSYVGSTDTAPTFPHPLHWRASNGAVFYPVRTDGWYWGVELRGLDGLTVHEAWTIEDNGHRPFAWIADMYRQRARWKEKGEPAQLALKLAMNSIYGKLAQQVGFRIREDGTVKVPTYHQLEYAGYITAYTRAMIYRAMMLAPDAVIACETDSVTFTRPVRLPLGTELGEWELTEFDSIVYLQSGVYWALQDGEWKTRTRGFGRADITVDAVLAWLHRIRSADEAYGIEPLSVTRTRFNTLGQSIGTPRWRTWTDETRSLRAGTPGGKREHHQDDCYQCPGRLSTRMHGMSVARSLPGIEFGVPSAPYPILWIDGPSPMMEGIDELDDWVDEDEL